MMYMPRIATVGPSTWAQNEFWVAWLVLKPAGSCSPPKTRMSFAVRPAVVLGTFAHDAANGAAASDVARVLPATLVVAVADIARTITAVAAPTRSHRRLCIESLRFVCAGSPVLRRRLLTPTPREGASRLDPKTTAA